jgi:hypothetical protein
LRSVLILSACLILSTHIVSGQEPVPVAEGQGLCRQILNSGQCAQAIEARQIPLSHGRVRRDNVVLHLRLTGGKMISVVNDTTGQEATDFSYLGASAAVGYYVLWAQHDEGSSIRLVNVRTGWSVIIDAMPVVSPDRHHIVTASQSQERYNPERLVVWYLEGDTLRREWALTPPDAWVPTKVRWLSNRSFEFVHTRAWPPGSFERQASDTAQVDSAGHWTTRLGP